MDRVIAQHREQPRRAIVADIGGTNARFAVADLDTLRLTGIRRFLCADYPTFTDAYGAFLAELGAPPDHAAIAVAGPVVNDCVRLTNSPWSLSRQEICHEAGLSELLVLNDFEALALALPHLAPGDLRQIGGEAPRAHGTKLVLGPGTGLGVAGLAWSGDAWVAVPGEGGHVGLAAQDEDELALLALLRPDVGHISVEHALSGPGIAALYRAIAASRSVRVAPLEPNDVIERALLGEDEIAAEALRVFILWLGRFAGDAALLFGAKGGVYLGGGIAPKIVSLLAGGAFRAAFEHKGCMSGYLAPVPIYAILADFAALRGAAVALKEKLADGV